MQDSVNRGWRVSAEVGHEPTRVSGALAAVIRQEHGLCWQAGVMDGPREHVYQK